MDKNRRDDFRRPPHGEHSGSDDRPHRSGPRRSDGPNAPQGERGGYDRPRRADGGAPQGDRAGRPAGPRPQGDDRGYGDRAYGNGPRSGRPGDRPYGNGPRGGRSGDRPGYGDSPRGGRPGYGDSPRGDRAYGDAPRGDRPDRSGDRPRGDRSYGEASREDGPRRFSDARPRGTGYGSAGGAGSGGALRGRKGPAGPGRFRGDDERPHAGGDARRAPRGDRPGDRAGRPQDGDAWQGDERPRRPYGSRPDDGGGAPRRPAGPRYGADSGRPEGGPPRSRGTARPGPRQDGGSPRGDRRFPSRYDGPSPRRPGTDARPAAPQQEIDGPMRLNRFLARAGVAARRKADELIASGAVAVNGTVVTEMGVQVQPGDAVTVHGRPVTHTEHVYLLFNKPDDVITTKDDERGRETVLDFIDLPDSTKGALFPVGRLDRHTTGVLLLTTDGELAHRLLHPSYGVEKVYRIRTRETIKPHEIEALKDGVTLDDGPARPDQVGYVALPDYHEIGMSLHEGRNRIVRRMMEALGHEVVELERVRYADLSSEGVRRGKWRRLTAVEVKRLRRLVKL